MSSEQVNEVLERFTNRQVVINTYEEEELVERDGLHFDRLLFTGRQLEVYRNGSVVKSVPVRPSATFAALAGFKDHYAFMDGESRIELYFPH